MEPSGISARPFLEGKRDYVRTDMDWYAFELFGNAYVMKGNYKLMKVRPGMFGDGLWHLYDVVNDPSESTPLEDKMPSLFSDMLFIYKNYANEHNIIEVDDEWSAFKGATAEAK
ncbi:hypothetical protein [Flammeovirga pacifica]|uniref:N-sulphoglucosamine sulphohydrolase C-terminal domain-containing protein n=1 Tax=Flammeovirga pacifica TaxID=915059 RepID=A0A1S1YVP8_FLAPC|nr:hypothetical protein [Flammeovirga pacifica]OHX65099.1 hypothetical protein NH26_01395 [Flammeovirga pacifica]